MESIQHGLKDTENCKLLRHLKPTITVSLTFSVWKIPKTVSYWDLTFLQSFDPPLICLKDTENCKLLRPCLTFWLNIPLFSLKDTENCKLLRPNENKQHTAQHCQVWKIPKTVSYWDLFPRRLVFQRFCLSLKDTENCKLLRPESHFFITSSFILSERYRKL